MSKFRMYVDEVGNSDLDSSDNPNHRFLSLTGIILELEYVRQVLYPEMEKLKTEFFKSHPDDPVILHRKEIMNAYFPFSSLRDPDIREMFDSKLLELLKKWEYRVITVCIDKKRHKETYTSWRYDPYHYCLALLIERYVLFLKRINWLGDLMAESRGGKEDRRLKDSFSRLYKYGTEYISPELLHERLTSRELKVKPKINNISGLQLADLIAHPSRNEILVENNITAVTIQPFGKKIIGILQSKYDFEGDKVYGKKYI